jgi:hypothetical protein
MPLPSSGNQIALSQIRNEFGLGSGQIAMSQLYGKGNAPASSGAVQCGAHFYGVSAVTYLAEFTMTIGRRNIKAGQDEYGFMTTAYGATGFGTTNYGSVSPTGQTVNGRQVSAIHIFVDTALSNTTQLRLSFGGGTATFTNWTAIIIGNTTVARTSFTATSASNSTYRFTKNPSGNIIGTSGTKTIKFI